MRSLFIGWVRDALALWVAILLVPGIYAQGNIFAFSVLLILFGFVSIVLRPAYLLFSFPIVLITTAPLMLIFNTLTLWLYAAVAGYLGLGLTINGFVSALLGALTISIIRTMTTGFTLMLSRRLLPAPAHPD
jgi:putative membrane protein